MYGNASAVVGKGMLLPCLVCELSGAIAVYKLAQKKCGLGLACRTGRLQGAFLDSPRIGNRLGSIERLLKGIVTP